MITTLILWSAGAVIFAAFAFFIIACFGACE